MADNETKDVIKQALQEEERQKKARKAAKAAKGMYISTVFNFQRIVDSVL